MHPWHRFIILAVITLSGCAGGGSGSHSDANLLLQPFAVAAAAAKYHAEHGAWPETREALANSSANVSPLKLRNGDTIWLRENEDGSATVIWFDSGWLMSTGTALRVIPPQPANATRSSATAETQPTSRKAGMTRDDYRIEATSLPKRLGKPLE